MSTKILPEIVATYIDASNRLEVKDYVATFALDATIKEDSIGKELVGRSEIANYFTTYFVNTKTHTELLDYTIKGDTVNMRVMFRGNFSGGEIVGLYHFLLKDGLIQELKADLE